MDPVSICRAEPAEQDLAPLAAEAKLLQFSELLFFAYRDFTGDPDAILRDLGFGRAHHRVLHFVNRRPGLRVADLLVILKITKQSLGRVLRQLIDQGYIRQEPGPTDRRERLLFPTESGRMLAKRLAAPQLVRLAKALAAAGPDAEEVVAKFLAAMTNDDLADGAVSKSGSPPQNAGKSGFETAEQTPRMAAMLEDQPGDPHAGQKPDATRRTSEGRTAKTKGAAPQRG